MSEGISRLIPQRKKVDKIIPILLDETKPNKRIAIDPLTPSSVIAMLGIIDIIKNIDVIKTKASKYVI